MWEYKNQNKQINNKKKQHQTYKYREKTYGCQKAGRWRMGKIGEGEWKIQTSDYGMNKSWGQKSQHRVYS